MPYGSYTVLSNINEETVINYCSKFAHHFQCGFMPHFVKYLKEKLVGF